MKHLFLVMVMLILTFGLATAQAVAYEQLQPLLDEAVQFLAPENGGKAGAVPMLVEENGDQLTIVCELYTSEWADYDPAVDDAFKANWIGTGEFLLEKSDASPYGYALIRFTQATDEAPENPLATYTSEVLGLSFAYPSELSAYLTESETGMEAAFPNEELMLYATVTPNSSYTLESYAALWANQQPDGLLSLYPEAGYFTLVYEAEDHWTAYRVVSVTEAALYEVELRFVTPQADLYGLFTEYLENSFTVFEYSVG